uniref:BED-type domain-containing protein n=1 Tax=Anopheles christyi TaxID=43041 RepID=A0A182KF76_9DIPT
MSDVWQYFDKTENAGKCLYCSKIIRCTRGSTSNLKRHLSAKHVGIPLKRGKYSSSNRETNNDEECSLVVISQSSAEFSPPTTMDTFFPTLKPPTADAKRKHDELFLQLICQESLPFSITESEAFKKYSQGLNPNYDIPSRKTLYLHSGKNIAEWIKRVTKKFDKANKLVAIVTDNASNISCAAKELELNHFACFAHSLNLVVKKSIQNTIGVTVEEVKRIVTFFRKSSTATQKLNDVQSRLNYPNLKLKQEVGIRHTIWPKDFFK